MSQLPGDTPVRGLWRREDWQRMAALHLVHHGRYATRAAARIMRLPKSTVFDWIRQGPMGIRDERLRSIAQNIVGQKRLTESEYTALAEALRQAEAPAELVLTAEHRGNPQALRDWYDSGAGGSINWGASGDFEACLSIASKYIDNAAGFCQERHIQATGAPAGKAPGEKMAEPPLIFMDLLDGDSSPPSQDGVMVAFFLPADVAEQLAMDGESDPTALPASELHLTLAFLGTADELVDPGRLCRVVAGFAAIAPPVPCEVSGAGRFATGERTVYASVDAPLLPAWRQRLIEHLRMGGFQPSITHGFTPHISLCNPDGPVTLDVQPIEFVVTLVTVTIGSARYDYPLEGTSEALFAESNRARVLGEDAPARPDPDRDRREKKDTQEGWERGKGIAQRRASNYRPVEGVGEPGDAEELTHAMTADEDLDETQEHPPTRIMDRLALEAWRRYTNSLANDTPHTRAIHIARQIDPDFYITDEQARRMLHALGKGDQPVLFGWSAGSVKPPPHVTSIYDQFEGSAAMEQELAEYLFNLAQESYLEGLNAQLLQLGLSIKASVTDPTILDALRMETTSIAQGIVKTYNATLAGEVYSAWVDQRSTLGRQSSLRTLWEEVNRWAEARATDRADMISSTEYGRWFNRGVLDFMNRNRESLGDKVRVYVSPDECVCSACLALVQDGPYTPDEANQLGLPLHVRCIHFLSLEMEPADTSGVAPDDVWSAQLEDAA